MLTKEQQLDDLADRVERAYMAHSAWRLLSYGKSHRADHALECAIAHIGFHKIELADKRISEAEKILGI
jgi:hypothetical protein